MVERTYLLPSHLPLKILTSSIFVIRGRRFSMTLYVCIHHRVPVLLHLLSFSVAFCFASLIFLFPPCFVIRNNPPRCSRFVNFHLIIEYWRWCNILDLSSLRIWVTNKDPYLFLEGIASSGSEGYGRDILKVTDMWGWSTAMMKVAYFIWSHSCLFNHDCQLSSLDSPPENFIGKRGHFAWPWKIIASSILSKQHISIMLSFAKGGNIGSYIELQSDRMHRNLCQNTIEYDNMLIIKMMFWKETTLWMTITTLRWYSASRRGRRAPLVTFVGVRHCTLLSYTSL